MTILLSDNFSGDGPINKNKWHFNQFKDGGSFYGRTQQRQELPNESNGAMHLRLDTFNPTGNPSNPTYLGSEAISDRLFNLKKGPISFEARVRYSQAQAGIMGGFFTFAGPPDNHDEIDFELVSTKQKDVQTNIYHDEPLSSGNPKFHALTSPLTQYHTYRIEWLSNEVRWLVDGKVIRTSVPPEVPTKPMALHFNIWGQNAGDPPYSDPSLNPTGTKANNQAYFMDVDYVKVETLSELSGQHAADRLAGTAAGDWMVGNGGADQLTGRAGDDTITSAKSNDVLNGGGGDDSLHSHAGNDTLVGGDGNDRLFAGAGHDVLTGGAGADRLDGGSGADLFRFESAADSTGSSYDDLRNVDFSVDKFALVAGSGTIEAVDAPITTGKLDGGSAFDASLTAAMAQLAAHHAVLFTADSGAQVGHTFLVADLNGIAGYQSGSDFVMRVSGSTGTLTTANFV